jgi:hypothetical protein
VKYFQRLAARTNSKPTNVLRGAWAIAGHRARPLASLGATPTTNLPGIFLRPSLPAGVMPSAVVSGDFNGDGKLDWIVANAGDNSLDLYLGNGDGTAQLPIVMLLTGQSPVGLAAADLNGDGKLDLVVAEADSGTVGILFGNGDGTFQPEVQISLPATPLTVAVADLNKDGEPDLLVGIAPPTENARFAALLNNGSGQFGPPIYAPNPTSWQVVEGWELSIADVNGDGVPDVLVTGPDASGTTTQIYLGNGDGTFTPGEVVDGSSALREVPNAVLADVTGDGCPDAIDIDSVASVRIYPGDCKGNFDTTTNFRVYGVGDGGYGLAVADLNGDGHPDIITGGVQEGVGGGYGTETGNTVTVRFNDGTGYFGPAHVYRGDPGIFSLVVADLLGNGRPEIITANQDANSTTLYTNDGSGGFGAPEGGYDGFIEGSIIGPGNAPDSSVVVADINGDGKPDLALIEYAENSASQLDVTVMLNEGNGQFSAPIRSPAISPDMNISDFVFADFRKTGQPDFLAEVFGNSGTAQLIYAKNMGDGLFGTPTQIPFPAPGGYAYGTICVGDFNRDGNLDFAVATATGLTATPNQLTIYLGHGDGTFTQSYLANFGSEPNSYPRAMFVGDANGDGKPDIFVWLDAGTYGPGTPGNKDLFEFLGYGDGTFQAPRDVLQYLRAMTMVDLDHDGRLDVIDIEASICSVCGTAGIGAPQVNIYLGQPDGSFGPSTTYSPYSGFWDVFGGGNNVTHDPISSLPAFVGDFNGDGNIDVALFQQDSLGPGYVQFLLGNGDGTFTPTYDVFGLGIEMFPDLTAPNLLGDGRTALLQTPNFTASYQVLPATNAPSFQIAPTQVPVLGGADAVEISLNVPSTSDTMFSLSASNAGVQLPPLVTIPAGQLSTQVPFTLAQSVPHNRWFSISAQANGETEVAYDLPGTGSAIELFGLAVTQPIEPTFNTVQQGGVSGLWSASIQSNGDASATFQISCVGLPSNASCEFQDGLKTITVPPGGYQNTSFQISADRSTPVGAYTFGVVATDGQRTLTSPETLKVTSGPPVLSISSTQVALGMVMTGTVSPPSLITVTNSSQNSVSAFSVSFSANNQPRIGIFNQTNTCGSTLAANSSCNVSVTFTSNEPGTSTGQIAVGGQPGFTQIFLSATAVDFFFQTAPGGSGTSTVSSGQTAVVDLQVIPDVFTGPITLACSTTAPGANCGINTSTLNVANSTPLPFRITISTTGSSLVAPRGRWTTPAAPFEIVLIGCSLAMIALLLALMSGAPRQRAMVGRIFLSAVFLALALMLASCGGGTSGGSGSVGTAPGTYPVTVTGIGDGVTRSLQLTLIVR